MQKLRECSDEPACDHYPTFSNDGCFARVVPLIFSSFSGWVSGWGRSRIF